jgi:hypothetical protein
VECVKMELDLSIQSLLCEVLPNCNTDSNFLHTEKFHLCFSRDLKGKNPGPDPRKKCAMIEKTTWFRSSRNWTQIHTQRTSKNN